MDLRVSRRGPSACGSRSESNFVATQTPCVLALWEHIEAAGADLGLKLYGTPRS